MNEMNNNIASLASIDLNLFRVFVAIYKEKSELLKQKIKKAMKYPMAVIVVAVIVTIILMVKVVPVAQVDRAAAF